jgi:hypothetical protein
VFSIVTVEIVDQDSDGEREPAQRHRVERISEEVEDRERAQDRQRDGNHHHDRRPPRSEKQHDHQGRQPRCDRAFAKQPLDRGLDEDGLVEQLLNLNSRRSRCAGGLHSLLDGVHNGKGRGIAVLDDVEQHRLAAFSVHHVLLNKPSIMDLPHIFDEHRGAVDELDRDIVEVLDAGRQRVGPNGKLRIPDF